MATKKYLSLERLAEYDELIKAEIAEGDANVNSALTTHTGNTTVHITSAERTNWNAAKTHADSAHAPSNAEKNIIVGIQKNGTDLTVDSSTRKVNIVVPTTAADIGAAAASHEHSASNITSGTLPIARGGTGATSASAARTNLEVYSTAEVDTKVSNAVSGLATASSVSSAISTHNSATDAHSDIRATLAAVKEDVDAFFADATISDAAKDTLKEIQDYITSDVSAAAEMTASIASKADKVHTHEIADVSGLQSALDGKASTSHGTHVTWSTTSPKANGTASVGTETKVARGDHVHPTDTTRASKSEFDTHVADTTKHITSTERTNWGTAYTHSQAAHAPSNAEKNQNAFSNVKVDSTTIAADTTTDTLEIAAGAGISVSGDATNDKVTITNSGVIAVATGTANGTISVNTNGTAANVAVKGLGSAAYTNSSAYATSDHTHTVDSALSSTSTNPVQNKVVNSAITTLTSAVNANTGSISAHSTAISELQTAVSEIQEITSAEIQALFK